MGETVPPSIAMLIVGSFTSVSVGAMFIGGLIPAAIMAICLMVLINVRARRSATGRTPRAPSHMMARTMCAAVLPLLMPAILLGGILLGIATPTEVAALAVVYGLVLAMLVYRELAVRDLVRALLDTAALTAERSCTLAPPVPRCLSPRHTYPCAPPQSQCALRISRQRITLPISPPSSLPAA
jgi:TRAP-type C4-dicarboxylate transport system permease large subunit